MCDVACYAMHSFERRRHDIGPSCDLACLDIHLLSFAENEHRMLVVMTGISQAELLCIDAGMVTVAREELEARWTSER